MQTKHRFLLLHFAAICPFDKQLFHSAFSFRMRERSAKSMSLNCSQSRMECGSEQRTHSNVDVAAYELIDDDFAFVDDDSRYLTLQLLSTFEECG